MYYSTNWNYLLVGPQVRKEINLTVFHTLESVKNEEKLLVRISTIVVVSITFIQLKDLAKAKIAYG